MGDELLSEDATYRERPLRRAEGAHPLTRPSKAALADLISSSLIGHS